MYYIVPIEIIYLDNCFINVLIINKFYEGGINF